MVHELLEIKNNRVDLKHLENLEADMREIVLSSDDDKFFRKVMHSNFGDLAQEIEQLVRGFMQTKNSQAQFKTIEDMQRMIENFPEFKQSERCTTKHFNIFQELKKFVEGCNLYKVSEVEQDLVSTQGDAGKATNFKRVSEVLHSTNTSKKEKLRLLLLFSIRYEGDQMVFKLKELCRSHGISEPQL